ncbi:ABC-2 family transporter protein [Candidatus Roizmanbacteria bacterium]|nr:ABC-2 family transporter protein [Candidatus Roizmanbacteria bacterium]
MGKSLKKSLRLFYLYSKFSLKTIFQARMGIVLFTLGKVIRFLFLLGLIYIVFSQTRLVKGYSLNQMIIFYLTFNIIDSVSQLLFREVYRFRPQVVSGSFDLILIKPHHPFLRILVGGVDFLDFLLLIPYILLLFYFILFGQHNVLSLQSISAYLFLILNSLFIATAFHISVLALAILTTEIDHTILIYRDMIGLGRFPIEIYKEPVRTIFTFIIPIGIMMSFPPYALFNLLSWQFMLLSFLISSILLTISLKLWDLALKKYQSWGG